ncbi:hypothetical protein BHM03_00042284 [Ensete ventricosum]|nr:hypothetical protein BHM03_00042284 [Ensete ventricosum]
MDRELGPLWGPHLASVEAAKVSARPILCRVRKFAYVDRDLDLRLRLEPPLDSQHLDIGWFVYPLIPLDSGVDGPAHIGARPYVRLYLCRPSGVAKSYSEPTGVAVWGEGVGRVLRRAWADQHGFIPCNTALFVLERLFTMRHRLERRRWKLPRHIPLIGGDACLKKRPKLGVHKVSKSTTTWEVAVREAHNMGEGPCGNGLGAQSPQGKERVSLSGADHTARKDTRLRSIKDLCQMRA